MQVGVPVVPGTPGPVDSWQDADAFIKEYGFPGVCTALLVSFASTYVLGPVQSSSRPRWVAEAVACVSSVRNPNSRFPSSAP
jgi:hypothetical protein